MPPIVRLRPLAMLCLSSLLAAACTTAARRELPHPPARAMQAWKAAGGVRIAAQPYADAKRQKEVLGRDFARHGLLPVLVLVENTAASPRILRRRAFVLRFVNGGESDAEQAAAEAAEILRGEGVEWNRAIGGSGGIGYGAIDVGLGYLLGEVLPAREQALRADGWQLPNEITLEAGQRIRGFVYFRLSADSPQPLTGLLRVALSEPQAVSQPDPWVELELHDLAPAGPP